MNALWNAKGRTWWAFKLPEATSYAPGETEAEARAVLAKNSYPNAPIHEWPLVGRHFISRDVLSLELVAGRVPAGELP